MSGISGAIICLNEAHNIARCILSIKDVVDEIIVIDSGSKDETVKIAEGLGAIVIQNEFLGHIEQKNFAIEQCNHKFILSLDADECLSKELTQSILKIKADLRFDAYYLNRLNNYCGKWIKHSDWYPDQKIRLWNKHKGQWGGINPHDEVLLKENSTKKFLHGDLLHYTYSTEEEHDRQIELFTEIAAKALFKKGKSFSPIRPYASAILKWLKLYIWKKGFLDGKAGLKIAQKSAKASYLKYHKLQILNAQNA